MPLNKETKLNHVYIYIYIYIYNVFCVCVYVYIGECPRGVMVKAMDCGIVVSEFAHQSR